MPCNHLIAVGLEPGAFAELERLLERALPGVLAEPAASVAELGEMVLADLGTVLLLPFGESRDGRADLERLRARGIGTPALLLVSAAALHDGLPLGGLGVVDALPREGYTAFDLQRALLALDLGRGLQQRLLEAEAEREQAARRLDEQARRFTVLQIDDELTGLRNERYMLQRVDEAVRLARRYAVPISCAVLGLDNLGEIRDRGGAALADFVLAQSAQRLRAAVRETDLLARYGPAEFFLLSLFTSSGEVEDLARRLHSEFSTRPMQYAGEPVVAQLSVGVASFRAEMSGSSELIQTAVEALAQARERRQGVEAL